MKQNPEFILKNASYLRHCLQGKVEKWRRKFIEFFNVDRELNTKTSAVNLVVFLGNAEMKNIYRAKIKHETVLQNNLIIINDNDD